MEWKQPKEIWWNSSRQKYVWKSGFSDMAKLGDACGQIGGCWSGGSPEIICEENFYWNGLNLVSMHRRFQLCPIFPAQNFLWPWKWPSKLKSHFFRGSFSRLTFQVRRGPCLDGTGWSRHGISVKNSTDEYFSPKIAHKTRILRHIAICAKTAKIPLN